MLKPRQTALLVLLGLAGAAQAQPVWISIGEPAYRLLLKLDSKVESRQSRRTATGETVRLVRVDEALLPRLSDAIHDNLRHCGGFIVHGNLQQARAALSGPASPRPATR
ncbi:hypothetical protein [Chromobacterium sp. CV08]|uniref:hypothetical protein n=1 Tax=Chromobacterium sp. CV08 TaxID=3133274 RepID=UPI003DA91606